MELQIYVTKDRKKPFLTWLNALRDPVGQAAVRTALNRLRLGNLSNSKSVGEGVTEYKIDKGPGYRLYFGRDGSELIILLVGGSKKSQQRDIDVAVSFWKDYKARKKGK